MMSKLPLASIIFALASCEFHSKTAVYIGDLCKKIFYFHIFIFMGVSITISSLILTVSQLQTQQLMTSQIRSHTEYLIQTYNIIVLILKSKLMKKSCLNGDFYYNLTMILDSGLLFGPPRTSRTKKHCSNYVLSVSVNI